MLESASPPAPARFLAQTAVTPDPEHPDRYEAFLGDEWNCPLVPHGGVVTAVGLRAMGAALGAPEQRLRSVNTVFVAQVEPGHLEIDVRVLRRGRSISQVAAHVRNAGREDGHRLVGVFGAQRRGFEFTERVMPDVPAPEQCPSWREAPDDVRRGPMFNFWEQVESRVARGHFPWDDYEPSDSERASWYRFEEPPLVDGTLDPLAVVAMCDTMPGAVGERVGSQPEIWLPPSADLTVHHFADTSSEWMLAVNRAIYAGDGYASLEIELWDPAGVLLAYATQVCFFTFLAGDAGA